MNIGDVCRRSVHDWQSCLCHSTTTLPYHFFYYPADCSKLGPSTNGFLSSNKHPALLVFHFSDIHVWERGSDGGGGEPYGVF